MEEEFLIPIDDAIEAFRHHLDAHDRTILSARFGDGKINITGNSEVIVDLEYDNQGDEELMYTESVPFTFSGIWYFGDDGKIDLEGFEKLEFDTSSFDN